MIRNIKIENFKSIQSLDLDLGRLNVFIGANGSGKSNILEAIALGSAASTDNLNNSNLVDKGFRVNDFENLINRFDASERDNIYLSFMNDDNDEELYFVIVQNEEKKLTIVDTLPTNELTKSIVNNKKLIERIKDTPINQLPENKTLYDVVADAVELYKKLKKDFNDYTVDILKDFIVFSPENTILRRFEEERQNAPLGVNGEGLFKHLVNLDRSNPSNLREINENLALLDWFENLEIPKDLMFTEKRINIKDRFLENGLSMLNQRSANEGFLFLLFYFTLFISDKTPKFFAIDNIDNALNPKLGSELIRILAKLAKKHGKQVILTTHNPAILDGLDLEDDNQRLFVISRNKLGHTKATRVPYKDNDLRLSESFIRGYIGGLPKNF